MIDVDLPEGRRLEVRELERSGWLLPMVDPVSSVYFAAAREGFLLYEHCAECGSRQHYPRGFCMHCGAVPTWKASTGAGEIHTFTVVRQNGLAEFRDQLPYVLALIDLDDGIRVMGNVLGCDPEEVRIGARVAAFTVPIADEIGLPQWELV